MKTENFQTKTEAEVLAATAAALAKGEDPFGDDDDDDAPGASTDEGADEQGDADGNPASVAELPDDEAGDDGDKGDATGDDAGDHKGAADEQGDGKNELSKEALEALAGDDDDDDDTPAVPRFKTVDKDAITQQRKDLMAEDAKALKDMIDGVIEPGEYSTKKAEIQDKLDALLVQQTLSEANTQTEQQVQLAAINAIIANAKAAGEIDYLADPKAQKQFDAALRVLAADEDNASLPYGRLCKLAHKTVLSVRGITAKPAAAATGPTADAKPEPAKPRENGKGPTTLRNVPAASTPNSGGGLVEQMATLSGQAYQDAFDKLTPAQKAQLRGD